MPMDKHHALDLGLTAFIFQKCKIYLFLVWFGRDPSPDNGSSIKDMQPSNAHGEAPYWPQQPPKGRGTRTFSWSSGGVPGQCQGKLVESSEGSVLVEGRRPRVPAVPNAGKARIEAEGTTACCGAPWRPVASRLKKIL